MHEVGEIKINKSKHEMPLAIVLFNESYWQCPLCRIAVRFCDSLMEPQQSVPWGASQGLTSQGEAPWGTEGGPTKGEYPRDWLFGSAKGEWNRNAYFIKMYKLRNCLEEKIGFLLSRPLNVELPSNLLHSYWLLSPERRGLYLPAFIFSFKSFKCCIIKVSQILLDKK